MPRGTREIDQEGASLSHTGLSPSSAGLSRPVPPAKRFFTSRKCCIIRKIDPRNPCYATHTGLHVAGLGSFPFARRYSENRDCFLFLQVLRCFSSLRWPPNAYRFSAGFPDMTRDGLPHSEILGSKIVCISPRLIAAYHVLHRLLVPRHPPYALNSLTKNLSPTAGRFILR